MRITVIGKGNVGSGLARRWEVAGHTVTAVGREGGDAAGAEAILVAVPRSAISDALAKVRGLGGQVTIDATNTFGALPGRQRLAGAAGQVDRAWADGQSVQHELRGAVRQGRRGAGAARYAIRRGPGAREVTERLTRDAGFDPAYIGDLSQAALLESLIALKMGVARGGLGPFFYRFSGPGGFSPSTA